MSGRLIILVKQQGTCWILRRPFFIYGALVISEFGAAVEEAALRSLSDCFIEAAAV